MNYSLIIDAIALIIGLLVVYSAYQKGFVRSVILVIGYILSIFAAIYLSKLVSTFIYDTFISQAIIDGVNNIVSENAQDLSVAAMLPLIFSKLPKIILNPLLGSFGGEAELISLIDGEAEGILSNIGTAITVNVIEPIMISLLEVISCLIIFFLCTIIVQMVARLFKGLYSVPIIGSINALLGGILGIIQAGVLYYVAALVISIIISLSANQLPYLNNEIIRQTYILKWFF